MMKFDKRLRMNKIHAERVREILVQRFPLCFAPKGEAKRPLKIGIGFDVQFAIPELSSYSVNIALEDYTNGRTYCAAIIAGNVRFDLQGNECGFVSETEANHCKRRLESYEREAALHQKGSEAAGADQ
jgi:sRNA-binding protein